VKGKYLNSGLGCIKNSLVFKGARHFALQATRALGRVYIQGLLQSELLRCYWLLD